MTKFLLFFVTLSIVSTPCLLSTAKADAEMDALLESINAQNDRNNKVMYDELAAALPKLHLDAPLDMALSKSKYPYLDWSRSHPEYIPQYLALANWLTGTAKFQLSCQSSPDAEETAEERKARETLSMSTKSFVRTFSLWEYVKTIPQFADCGLDEAEYDAIFDYTEEVYQTLNPALRRRSLSEDKKAFVNTLNRALNKIANYQGWVKRGDSLSDDRKKWYTAGTIISDPGYFSTSLLFPFVGNSQFEILSKTGKYIAPLAGPHGEEEVIFKPGTRFKIIGVNSDDQDPSVTHYKMEELGDGDV